ncbi:unnamed protein product, partial [Amoebophrya sp. A25]
LHPGTTSAQDRAAKMSFANQPTPSQFPWLADRGKLYFTAQGIRTPALQYDFKKLKKRYWYKRKTKMVGGPNGPLFKYMGVLQNENLPIGMRNFFDRERLPDKDYTGPKVVLATGNADFSLQGDWRLTKPVTPIPA